MMNRPEANRPNAAARARILIVDDMAPVRDIIAEVLRSAGHDPEAVPDADTALQLGRFARWDLLVLDVDLPGMSGPELYKHLCRITPDRVVPAIFISGRPQDQHRHGLGSLPFVRFLAKPFELAGFLEAVGKSLRADCAAAPDPRKRNDPALPPE